MKKFKYLSLLIILLVFFTVPNSLFANYKANVKEGEKGNVKRSVVLQKTTVDPTQSLLNVNNATMWVTDAGYHDWVVASGWNGAFPNGQAVGAIFTQGIVWGGQVNDGGAQLIRVGGNTYGSGTANITRLFRVRSDYLTADLTNDAATFNDIPLSSVSPGDIEAIKAQYEKDWSEWPVNEGAPFEERNGVSGYQPAVDANNNDKFEPEEGDIPGIPGATQTIFIKYNDNNSTDLFGANPIGMEVTEVYWAYAASGPLANVLFDKVTLVYKGLPTSAANSRIDSMYIAQMSDPDVGNSTDDFAGCDTLLNLGYAYSSKTSDGTYAGVSLPPPAVGYDYLQGVSVFTGNPNDSAIFDLKWRKGYKYVNNVPMSSFAYFAAGGTWEDPTETSYSDGALAMYNLMRGDLPRPVYPAAPQFPDEVADRNENGVYLLTGDPVAGTGKIDGVVDGPGDRRILPINGPFTMNLGDTAQVVVAIVYGMGVNNLSSISVLKFNDASAQFAYDQLFNVPLMPTPKVKYAELNGEVTAYWNQTEEDQNNTETVDHGPYKFQAYALYQLPPGGKDISVGTRIATFDVVDNISFMQEKVLDPNTGIVYTRPLLPLENVSGVKRNFVFNKDYLNNKPLIDGQSYTFAITSIGYNDDPGLPQFILESAPFILNVTPQSPNPGVRLGSAVGDTILAEHSQGVGDGSVLALVVDPTKLTGHQYKVKFDDTQDPVTWDLIDVTDNNKVVLSGQTNQSGDDNYLIVDGMMVKVVGPAPGIKTNSLNDASGMVEILYESQPVATDAAGAEFGGNTVWHSLNSGGHTDRYYVSAGGGAGTLDRMTRSIANAVPYDYKLIFTDTTQSGNNDWGVWGFDNGEIARVPFQLWRYDPVTGDSVRLIPVLYSGGEGTPGVFGTAVTDGWLGETICTPWIYWYYDSNGYDAFATACAAGDVAGANNFGEVEYFARMIFGDYDGNGSIAPAGTVVKIVTTKPSTSVDEFTFVSKAPTTDNNLAKADVEKINVFPNPYYGYQYRETSPTSKYVTFNHLPDNAVIRIFDLSGVLVRTINHNTGGQFETWDLSNDNNYPVASGIYVVYIDMPDLGTTKVLKLAVIQEQQILKVY